MGEMRGKSDKGQPLLPAPRPRPQIPASLGKLPGPLARLAPAQIQKPTSIHKFDKAFAVMLKSDFGTSNGVGRNISAEGMFIETREPLPMGTEVQIVFSEAGAEIVAIATVRFQCFLNFAGADGDQEGMRGMGVRFLRFEGTAADADAHGSLQ